MSSMSTPAPRRAVNGVLWLGAQALGVGLVLFSAPAVIAPRLFGGMAGLGSSDDPSSVVAVRSVAVRDVVMGVGLVSAARQHAPLSPWLLLRIFSDGGDTLGILMAFVRGGGNRRLGLLGAIALGATVYDVALYAIARRDES
jgi:hypothetical protein